MMTGVFVFSHTDLFSVLCLVDVICRTYWIPLFHLVELCCACIPIVLKGESRDSRGSCWERWGGFTFFFLKHFRTFVCMVINYLTVKSCQRLATKNFKKLIKQNKWLSTNITFIFFILGHICVTHAIFPGSWTRPRRIHSSKSFPIHLVSVMPAL